MGIKTDGSLWAWGANYDGELGLGAAWEPTKINTAPLLSKSKPSARIAAGKFYQYVIAARDPDGDVVTLDARVLPGWLTFDPSTGTLSGTPRASDVGSHRVELTASDGKLTKRYSFQIRVVSGG